LKATSARFEAFSITSMLMSVTSTFRRTRKPTPPMTKRSALRTT